MPYPAETEIIANVVTSPHHLSATMVTGRVHRMTELFGRLAPGADLESARAELRAVHAAMVKRAPRGLLAEGGFPHRRGAAARSDHVARPHRAAGAAGRVGAGLRHRLLERRQPDSGAHGPARRRAGDPRGARRRHRRAAPDAARRKPAALRRRRGARRAERAADGRDPGALRLPLLRARARPDGRFQHAVGRARCWRSSPRCCWRYVPRLPSADASHGLGLSSGSLRITGSTTRRLRAFAITQIAASFVLLAGAGMLLKTLLALQAAPTGFDTRNVLAINVPVDVARRSARAQSSASTRRPCAASASCPGVDRVAVGTHRAVARRRQLRSRASSSPPTGTSAAPGEEDPRAPVPHRLARLLRRARRADHRRPRLQRRGPPRQRAGRHRQPEPGAAHVPEPGRGQPPPDVDRSGHEVHRRQHRSAAHRRRRRRYRRRERRAGPGAERLSPVRAGDWRRPAVRARAHAIRTRWSRRSPASSATCRPTSRSSAPATLEDVRAECSRRIG